MHNTYSFPYIVFLSVSCHNIVPGWPDFEQNRNDESLEIFIEYIKYWSFLVDMVHCFIRRFKHIFLYISLITEYSPNKKCNHRNILYKQRHLSVKIKTTWPDGLRFTLGMGRLKRQCEICRNGVDEVCSFTHPSSWLPKTTLCSILCATSRCSDYATGWTSGFRFPAGGKEFFYLRYRAQIGSGARPAPYPMGTECSPRGKRPGRETDHSPTLVPRLIMREAVPPLHHTS